MTYDEFTNEVASHKNLALEVIHYFDEVLVRMMSGMVVARINKNDTCDMHIKEGRIEGVGYTERLWILQTVTKMTQTTIEER